MKSCFLHGWTPGAGIDTPWLFFVHVTKISFVWLVCIKITEIVLCHIVDFVGCSTIANILNMLVCHE